MNETQHAIGSQYSRIEAEGCELIIQPAAGVCRELRDQFIAARNAKFPWSTKPFVCTVHEIEHYDVVSSGIFVDQFSDKNP